MTRKQSRFETEIDQYLQYCPFKQECVDYLGTKYIGCSKSGWECFHCDDFESYDLLSLEDRKKISESYWHHKALGDIGSIESIESDLD